MAKSVRLALTVVAFALIGSIVFAYAPVMKPLPNVYIGDMEDWWGTVDTNLFIFSDAFNLDDYVTDEDTTISELAWSFWEDGAGGLQLNGITELDNPSDAVNAKALGKDIRSVKATVDFWDIKDVPDGGSIGTYPDISPSPSLPWPDPTDPLNEWVTMFVTDGTYVDSAQMWVEARDDTFDEFSPTTAWVEVYSADFEGDTDGWTFTGISANTGDISCTGATSSYDGSRLGITTDNTTSRFGYWGTPGEPITYEANKLYKFSWKLTTDAAQNDVPTIRFRVSPADFSYSMAMTLQSANGASNPFMPTATEKEYRAYVVPLSSANMAAICDVYDFDPVDQGTVYIEELAVFNTDIPSDGWTPITPPAFSSWSAVTSVTPYHSVSSGTTGGLQLSSSVSENFAFGFWSSPYVTSMSADTLYRVVFTVASSDASPPNGMFRIGAEDLQVSYRLRYYLATAPDADGEDYPVYFESHDFVSGLDDFYLAFEIADFENTQGGTITLTGVTLESHDLIP